MCRRADVDKMLDTMFVNVFPERCPAGGGKQQGAQVKDALGSLAGPFHAAAAEPRFDKGFTGGFGHAAANRHGHGLGGAVVHPLHVMGVVGRGGFEGFDVLSAAGGRFGPGVEFFGESFRRPPVVFEGMTGGFQPGGAFGLATLHPRGGCGKVAAGMIEVEDLPSGAGGQPGFVVPGTIGQAHPPGFGIVRADPLPFAIQPGEEGGFAGFGRLREVNGFEALAVGIVKFFAPITGIFDTDNFKASVVLSAFDKNVLTSSPDESYVLQVSHHESIP